MMRNVRKISRRYYVRQIMACMLVCFLLLGMPVQIALAATPVVGSYDPTKASISQTTNETIVELLGEQAIINWDNFNTAEKELLQFFRDNGMSSFAVLNRVSGGETLFD
ncbi:MAG: hypothetical protein GTO40_23505, partial [Deltaproteobacteria bacterium]|nr:hypothetical protein [Deltaproteobacteria bacterium]